MIRVCRTMYFKLPAQQVLQKKKKRKQFPSSTNSHRCVLLLVHGISIIKEKKNEIEEQKFVKCNK